MGNASRRVHGDLLMDILLVSVFWHGNAITQKSGRFNMDSELLFDAYTRQVTYFGHGLSMGSTLFVVARRVIGELQIPPEAYLGKGRIVWAIPIFLVCVIYGNFKPFPFSRRSVRPFPIKRQKALQTPPRVKE